MDPPVLVAMAAAILTVAAALRLFRLGSVPPPLADEVLAATDIRSLLSVGRHFTGATPEILSWITPALDGRLLIAQLMDPTVGVLRAVSALFGIGTVALVMVLGREFRRPLVGLAAAAALAVMPWHIYASRVYFPASEYLFCTALACLLLLVALRKGSLALALGAGATAAISIYLYPVALFSTPALLAAVIFVRRQELRRFGFFSYLIASEVGLYLLLPYALTRLRASGEVATEVNAVISAKLLWHQGLSLTTVVSRFVGNWASYFDPRFLFVSGDPNVAHSTQRVGQVGWAIAALACVGIFVAVVRRRPLDRLLVLWTILFPIGSAITAVDARANAVRGIAGALVWALWAAVGAAELATLARRRAPVVVAAGVLAVGVQTVLFLPDYFGSYGRRNASVFEVGYREVYPVLEANSLTGAPVTFHGGFRRADVLEYLSGQRVDVATSVLSCNDLPYKSLDQLAPSAVIVVRDDRSYENDPACSPGSVVERDTARLRMLERASGGRRRVELLAEYAIDEDGRRAAVFVVLTRGAPATPAG